MPQLIEKPVVIRAHGTHEKDIEEYVGRANTGHEQLSVARMISPQGWTEPAQRPDFLEVTVVLRGCVEVTHDAGTTRVDAGQAIVTQAGETVRYATPDEGGAEYVSVCLPAFSPESVHRVE